MKYTFKHLVEIYDYIEKQNQKLDSLTDWQKNLSKPVKDDINVELCAQIEDIIKYDSSVLTGGYIKIEYDYKLPRPSTLDVDEYFSEVVHLKVRIIFDKKFEHLMSKLNKTDFFRFKGKYTNGEKTYYLDGQCYDIRIELEEFISSEPYIPYVYTISSEEIEKLKFEEKTKQENQLIEDKGRVIFIVLIVILLFSLLSRC
jgi:hypothetical protein